VWIDGIAIDYERVSAPDVGDPQTTSAWARFPITFPIGEDVTVQVSYTLYPSGRRPFGGFEYIMETGAGWKDTIGKAVITVTLPDPVTAENVSLSGKSIEGLPISPHPDSYQIDGNTIHWELTDFEPTAAYNIYVEVLEPGRYHALLAARDRAAREPNSVDAQLELADAVQNAVMVVKAVGEHGGGKALAEEANAAYRRALELAPERAEVYIRYANWLLQNGGWSSLMFDGTCPQELCDIVQRGLKVAPNDPELIKIDEQIRQKQAELTPPDPVQNALSLTSTAETHLRAATTQALQTAHAFASLTPGATATASGTPPPPSPTALPGAEGDTASETRNNSDTWPTLWLAIGLPLVLIVALLITAKRRKDNPPK